ncbi:CueP family metal-binding protein [Glycomyces sp. NRRL B-16210]|uniref:CueP family metal-binding protein n=1 Tax=Glycomyces sp. NRRL B-16210 TaxID=1463821 RepID=UPI0004BF6723|nr:CueP family metal-binding protein [Glycomyces sp. NRRL B-16210]
MTTTLRFALSAASAIALALAVSACTATDSTTPEPDSASTIADADLDELAELGARDLIAALEATPIEQRRTDLRASIEPDRVLLSAGDREIAVPIPEDQHYLSIAPYVSSTHECFFHSLTTCTGELGGQDVSVRIVDDETGEVYVDESGALHDNGFIGFWLPADRTTTVTVTTSDGEGSATVSTGDEDLTCLTSLQIA